jgi:hypothetical protein
MGRGMHLHIFAIFALSYQFFLVCIRILDNLSSFIVALICAASMHAWATLDKQALVCCTHSSPFPDKIF